MRLGPSVTINLRELVDRRERLQTEDGRPKTEDRRPKTEDRRPRTEDRGPRTEDRGPRTEDRFSHLNLQNEDLRQNALLDAKTLNSMGSSFNSFTRLKLKNEDPR